MPKKPKLEKLDPFRYYEAVDRCMLIADLIESDLMEHPVLKQNRKLRDMAEMAQARLQLLAVNIVNLNPPGS